MRFLRLDSRTAFACCSFASENFGTAGVSSACQPSLSSSSDWLRACF